jgi:hypothetical protein
MCSTVRLISVISTRSPTSKGCLTKRKMQDPRTSAAVAEKTKESDRRAVPAVARVVVKDVLRKPTILG